MHSTVDILLTSYNGQAYLEEQLDSVFSQSFDDFHLLIRDDFSSDGTGDIISKYCYQHSHKISIIPDNGINLGAVQNFNMLMQQSTANYQMFCDQDDIWLPHKVEVTLNKMEEMEKEFGKDKPLLVHTDLKVVDEQLNLLSDSLWRYQLSDPKKGSTLNRLLLMNFATGCSVMVNRPLVDLALPIPAEAMMHDWWLALVAAAFGHIGHITEPTALYRQHGSNDIGAKKWNIVDTFKSMANLSGRKQLLELNKSVKQKIQRQAAAFLQRFGKELSDRQREMLERYVNLDEFNYFVKIYYNIKYGFYYTGLIRNIGHFISL